MGLPQYCPVAENWSGGVPATLTGLPVASILTCGKEIPYVIDPRRPGDIAECYADPTKAKNELGWVAEYGIEEMCADSWNWQKNNPDGYHTVK